MAGSMVVGGASFRELSALVQTPKLPDAASVATWKGQASHWQGWQGWQAPPQSGGGGTRREQLRAVLLPAAEQRTAKSEQLFYSFLESDVCMFVRRRVSPRPSFKLHPGCCSIEAWEGTTLPTFLGTRLDSNVP